MQVPITTTTKFIRLKSRLLIEIDFEFETSSTPDEYRFVRVSNRLMHLNLMLVDSKFPEILSDIVQCVNRFGSGSLSELIVRLTMRSHFKLEYADRYYQYKVRHFLELLLFSNLNSKDVCKGKIDSSIVYCCKNRQEETQFFSLVNRHELFDLIFMQSICTTRRLSGKGKSQMVRLSIRMPAKLEA